MVKKTKTLLYGYFFVFFALAVVLLFLGKMEKNYEKKTAFVKITGLPDLAISTEATFVRHRSLADPFSIYKDGPGLTDYFPSAFATSYNELRRD